MKHEIEELREKPIKQELKELMIEALKCSIISRKNEIAADIIQFASENYFPLAITDKEVDTMVVNKAYKLFARLMKHRTLYRIAIPDATKRKTKREKKLLRI